MVRCRGRRVRPDQPLPPFIPTPVAVTKRNQMRLWFASFSYVLLCVLRRIGVAHTQFAKKHMRTIRLKLLKIGALVRVSVRRISVAMACACPWQHEFARAHAMLLQ